MSYQLSFDHNKHDSNILKLANNLKLSLGMEFKNDNFDIKLDEECQMPRLYNEFMCLHEPNAILRYLIKDFQGIEDEEYKRFVSNFDDMCEHDFKDKNNSQSSLQMEIALDKYLQNLERPLSANDLILFADIYSMDPELVARNVSNVPSRIQKCIRQAKGYSLD